MSFGDKGNVDSSILKRRVNKRSLRWFKIPLEFLKTSTNEFVVGELFVLI